MTTRLLRNKIGGALLAFAILFGTGIASSMTAQAQYQNDRDWQYRRDRDRDGRRDRDRDRDRDGDRNRDRRDNRYGRNGGNGSYGNNGGYNNGGYNNGYRVEQ